MFEILAQLRSWLGAPFRWTMGRIRGDAERQQAWLIETVDAMATAMARSDQIGHGFATDEKYRAEMREAVELAGGRAAMVGDPAVMDAVDEFREAAGYLLDRSNRSDWQGRLDTLRAAHNLTLNAILQRQGKKVRRSKSKES